MIDQGITTLDTGAPDITYEGNEGVKSPEQEQQMMMAQLQEEYDKYVFEMEEQGIQPMSIEQFIEQTLAEGQMSGGQPLPEDPTKPINPFGPKPIGPVLPDRQMAAFGGIMGLDQRRQYGLGSKFKKALGKITRPFTKVAQKLMPKELAGIARMASPFLPPGYREAAYFLGTAKQKGRISPVDLALMASPTFFNKTDMGKGIKDWAGNLNVPFTDKTAGEFLVGDDFKGARKEGPNQYYEGQSGLYDTPQTGFSEIPSANAAAGVWRNTLPEGGTSGLIGKGGQMSQIGGNVGIMDSTIGQLAFGTPAKDTAGKVIAGEFAPSKLKLGSWAIGIVSGIQAGKYADEQAAADAAEAAALAADSEASEATLAAARAWAIETFGSMSVYADGGRIGYAFGGTGGKTSSTSFGGNQGESANNRERYRTAQYITPKTIAPPGEKGGQGYVTPRYVAPPVTTGGQSPFRHTAPTYGPVTTGGINKNTGITSNYINPTFMKHMMNKAKNWQLANQPNQLETWQSIFGGDVTPTGYIPKEFKPSGKYSTTVGKSGYEKAIEEGVGAKEFGSWLKKDGDMFQQYHPDYAKTLSKQLTLSDNVKALGEDYVKGFDIKGLGDSYDDQRKAVGTLLGDLKTKKEALKGTDKEMYLDSKDEFMKSLGVSEFTSDYSENKDRLNDLGITSMEEYENFINKSIGLAQGGRINRNMGGISSMQRPDVSPPGMELDLRVGGFIPIGAEEKADDVKARVSKNEFVFTADAVKAAGGGSVNEGAKRMYDTMKRLESQVG